MTTDSQTLPGDPAALVSSTQLSDGADLAGELIGPDGEPLPQEEVPQEEEVGPKPQDIWMDFETFCKCFK